MPVNRTLVRLVTGLLRRSLEPFAVFEDCDSELSVLGEVSGWTLSATTLPHPTSAGIVPLAHELIAGCRLERGAHFLHIEGRFAGGLLAVVARCRHKHEEWCNGKNDEPAHLGTDRI